MKYTNSFYHMSGDMSEIYFFIFGSCGLLSNYSFFEFLKQDVSFFSFFFFRLLSHVIQFLW